MFTSTLPFEERTSVIQENTIRIIQKNTRSNSFGYLIVNVTYMIADEKDAINNYNSTFVFGPDSRDVMLKEAEAILTSGLYLPDRIPSIKDALNTHSEFSTSHCYYSELNCESPIADKGFVIPVPSPSMNDTFLSIPNVTLIGLIVKEIANGRMSRLKGGKIDYTTYMDAGLLGTHKASTYTYKSPDNVNDSPKSKEKPNDYPINIFLSCGENATYDDDPDSRRPIRCTRITNLILANKNLSHLKPAPFNIISDERDFNDDNTEWYDKTIAKFTANIENIDVLCLVLPYLEKPIDGLDYSLMVLASDHKIPIHIITSNKDVNETIGMEDYIEQIETTYPNHIHPMYKRFIQKHSNLIIHPNEFNFIMGIAKKNK